MTVTAERHMPGCAGSQHLLQGRAALWLPRHIDSLEDVPFRSAQQCSNIILQASTLAALP